jgi:hypothetical protein
MVALGRGPAKLPDSTTPVKMNAAADEIVAGVLRAARRAA